MTTLLAIDIGNTNVTLGLFDYADSRGDLGAPLEDRHSPRSNLGRGLRRVALAV